MKKLSEIVPFVGSAHDYVYRGSSIEGKRIGYSYAFHLFMSGPAYMIMDERKLPLAKGSLVFVRPGQWHSFHVTAGHPLLSYNIYCDLWEASLFRSAVPQFSLFPNPVSEEAMTRRDPCPELDSLPPSYAIQPFPQLLDSFIQIVKIHEQSRYYRKEATSSLFYSWLLQLYNTFHARGTTDPRITQLIAKIENHPELHSSYEQWSELCGLQKSHFYSLFKKVTGLSPSEYLLKVKMKKAAALLQESNCSITCIADELGFSSIHYFTRKFTVYYGMNPTAFRSRSRT